MPTERRSGTVNAAYLWGLASVAVIVALTYLLIRDDSPAPRTDVDPAERSASGQSGELFMYCAAGMRYPMEEIVAQYKKEYGVDVQLQYGGSNTLLNQLDVSATGDLYLAGDDSYVRLAEQKELTAESFPLASMRPVLIVPRDNPKNITTADDLLREDVKVALGDPGAAAVGRKTRSLLSATGHWVRLEPKVTVFKPTVNDVANAVTLGSVDVGIVWDSTAHQYGDLRALRVPELDAGTATVEVAIVQNSKQPTAALHFARYVAARDRGLQIFAKHGFEVMEGDVWADRPEITFFAGAVNRRALEPIIAEFQQREGVQVNTVYNGCGILTAQMRTTMESKNGAFPDTYMACDVYYLETVKEYFQDAVNVSDTDIVIVVQKGNPKNIQSVADLTRPGVRVALGQPDQCTIGVLSRRLLQSEGVYDTILENGNLVTQTATSALLVPAITTQAADAVLAYRTDTLAERSRLDIVEIPSTLSKAVQPYSISRSSDFKYLGRRLFDTIARSRDKFESAGFHWRLKSGSASRTSQQSLPTKPASKPS